MNKHRMIRAALLAALALSVIVLGWLCLDTDNPMIVEIEAPIAAHQVAMCLPER